MLYYLFRYLEQYGISGAGMWQYISFRGLLTLVLSLLISMWLGQHFIQWMRKRNISEAQRDETIDPYGVEKKGVPSMGGLIIILSIIIPCVLLGRLRNIYMLLMLATTMWLGFIGFMDDYIKLIILTVIAIKHFGILILRCQLMANTLYPSKVFLAIRYSPAVV